MGSLTLRMRSPVAQMSSADRSMVAPAVTKASSGIDEPEPAPDSTYTSWPLRLSSCTPEGVIATRYSWFLTSRGMPIFTAAIPLPGALQPEPANQNRTTVPTPALGGAVAAPVDAGH